MVAPRSPALLSRELKVLLLTVPSGKSSQSLLCPWSPSALYSPSLSLSICVSGTGPTSSLQTLQTAEAGTHTRVGGLVVVLLLVGAPAQRVVAHPRSGLWFMVTRN